MSEKKGTHILFDLLTIFAFVLAGIMYMWSWMSMLVTHQMVFLLNAVVFLLGGILFQVSKEV